LQCFSFFDTVKLALSVHHFGFYGGHGPLAHIPLARLDTGELISITVAS